MLLNFSSIFFTSINIGGVNAQIRTGTGVAPANGTALSGTARGSKPQSSIAGAAVRVPFSLNAIVTVTIGIANWIDISLAAITLGTASAENISISSFEI